MKKAALFLTVVTTLFSCLPDTSDPNPFGGTDDGSEGIVPQDGNTLVDLTIELPPNAELSPSDLIVSGLFTDDTSLTAGNTSVEYFNGDGLELTFVTDLDQNIVLFGFVNPTNPSSFTLNSSSTAQALVLMHPWAMDLSTELKKQVMTEIERMPEFTTLQTRIEIEVSKENVDLLNNELVQSSLANLINKVLDSNAGKSKPSKLIDELKEPLAISTEGNTLTVKNIDNSMAYGIRLLGENGSNAVQILPDVNKNLFALDQIGRIISLSGFEETQVSFDIPNNQQYSIIAKNGLEFDNSAEDNAVFNRNAGKILISLLGLVSSSLKGAFSSDQCLDALGKFAFQNINQTFQKISRNQISNSDFLDDNLNLLRDNTVGVGNVLNQCNHPLVQSERLKLLISSVVKVKELFNAAEFGLLVIDWARYKNKIEFCIDKSTGEVVNCKDVTLSGELEFNRVPVGKPQNKTVTIRNNSEAPFKITEFKFPKTDFTSSPEIPNQGMELENGTSMDFTIIFNPQTVDDFSGEFEVITDLAENGTSKLEVLANGVNALKSDKTELDFGNILVGESSEPQTIILTNESDVDLILSEVPSIDGYTFNIPEQTLVASETVSIQVAFNPIDDFADYNTSLIFKTDSDQEDVVVALGGDGYKGLQLEVLSTPNDLDFGKVDVNSETGETKLLRISNPTDINIGINGFVFTNEAEGGYTTSLDNELANPSGITLASQDSREFTITFKPDRAGFFNGEFVVDNTESQETPIRLPIMGEGVELEISVNPDVLDFGEVEVGDFPSVRTFTITNNLDASAGFSVTPQHDEITTNWSNGTVLEVGEMRTVTAQFNPTTSTTTLNGALDIEAIDLNQFATVSYTASKKEDNTNILDGDWMPEWDVRTCEPTNTSNDTQCINHQNARPYVFIPNPNGFCQTMICGIMDFSNIRNGNSDTVVTNEWTFDGTTVNINIVSRSNGFFFTDRTFTYTGTYDENTDSFTGPYESEYEGGGTAGWKNKATGFLTLRRQ
ncbi:choice-of-anchor D domain-containing protein [Flagellimonas myxillae]|uniref:choice-of-anchor D domain-containing protein n=1 Tax=Flagellimonas myxillae TaxID=2942214 RepID=UPI00201FA6A4|nr:choice-of-anchor D domain-containing protein [Muricauda myxillae]MCL6265080.1 choice-of-anchor D domain-containing protein [Muricauda myxillae]